MMPFASYILNSNHSMLCNRGGTRGAVWGNCPPNGYGAPLITMCPFWCLLK